MVDTFDEITLIVADDWTRDAVQIIKDKVADDVTAVGPIMDALMATDGLEPHADQLPALAEQYTANPGTLPEHDFSTAEEETALEAAMDYLADRFDAAVTITQAHATDHDKADRARPGKPAIVLE